MAFIMKLCWNLTFNLPVVCLPEERAKSFSSHQREVQPFSSICPCPVTVTPGVCPISTRPSDYSHPACGCPYPSKYPYPIPDCPEGYNPILSSDP